eukprot:2328349-Pleurochrysis_carterae.AAC.6
MHAIDSAGPARNEERAEEQSDRRLKHRGGVVDCLAGEKQLTEYPMRYCDRLQQKQPEYLMRPAEWFQDCERRYLPG